MTAVFWGQPHGVVCQQPVQPVPWGCWTVAPQAVRLVPHTLATTEAIPVVDGVGSVGHPVVALQVPDDARGEFRAAAQPYGHGHASYHHSARPRHHHREHRAAHPVMVGRSAFRSRNTGDPEENNALVALGSTGVAGLAGCTAGRLRTFRSVKIVASGSDGLNQAVKGLAMSRDFLLPEQYSILVECVHAGGESEATERRLRSGGGEEADGAKVLRVCLNVTAYRSREATVSNSLLHTIRVKGDSPVERLAAEVLKSLQRVQLDGRAVMMIAMGASSVAVCVRALIMADESLRASGLGIMWRPRFSSVVDPQTGARPAVHLEPFLVQLQDRGSIEPPKAPSAAAAAAAVAGIHYD
eukprot:Hpha_TRINITY_DN15438_c4_g1::TRINITY_DN15438_c4_g1_i1::g.172942::m.172942